MKKMKITLHIKAKSLI